MKAQLAKPIGGLNPELLIKSPDWWVEEKYDGERVLAVYSGREARAFNRHGVELVLPVALDGFMPYDAVFDGEIVNGEDYYVFDVISVGDVDYTKMLFHERRANLEKLKSTFPSSFHLVQTAKTLKAKRRVIERVMEEGGEGMMFKKNKSKYYPGKRTSQWLKMKFTSTCDVVITEFNRYDPKDQQFHPESVGFKFYDDTTDLDMSIKIPLKYQDGLNVGDVVEVRYLRHEPSGKLYQPVFVRARPDKQANECLRNQLV